MPFQNFNNFDYMFNRTAEPITVEVPAETCTNYDDLGQPIKHQTVTQHWKEPITVTANPALTYQASAGGDVVQTAMIWISKHPDMPKYTKITRDGTGESFIVIGSTPMTHSQLTYYQLKSGSEADVRTDSTLNTGTDKEI